MAFNQGIDVRSSVSGTGLTIRCGLLDANGALVVSGTTTLMLLELQADGTVQTFDFNDNTFKTTTCTTPTLNLTHRKANNATTDTGMWTAQISNVTDFSKGAVYIEVISNSSAWPATQWRQWQFGNMDGDAHTSAVGLLEVDVVRIVDSFNSALNLANGASRLFNLDALVVWSGTAQGGSSTTITLDAGASPVDGFYKDDLVVIVGGTGAYQSERVQSYVGSTKVCTMKQAWATAPNNTSVFAIVPGGALATSADIAAIKAKTDNLPSDPADQSLLDANIDANEAKIDTLLTRLSSARAGYLDNLSAGAVALESTVQAIKASAVVREGTAQAGGANTITLDAGASAGNDFYKDDLVVITGGTGAGQSQFISSYNGTTKVATVSANWVTNPDNTSVFKIVPFGVVSGGGGTFTGWANVLHEGTATAGNVNTITLAATAPTINDFYQYQILAIVAGTGAQQADIISAYAGGTRRATMSHNWATIPDNTSQYKIIAFGKVPGASAPTATEVADAVFNALRDTHDTAGSFGEGINDLVAALRGKAKSNLQTGVSTFYESDGTTPRFTKTLQQGADANEVILNPS